MNLIDQRPAGDGTYYMVRAIARGIKKRCRKSGVHSLQVGYAEYRDHTPEEIESLKHQAKLCVDSSLRTVTNSYLRMDWVTFEGSIMEWQLLSPRNLKIPM